MGDINEPFRGLLTVSITNHAMENCEPLTEHLAPGPDLLQLADVVLVAGKQHWLGHSQLLALESPHIASLISLQREQPQLWRSLPCVSVLPTNSAPQSLLAAASDFGAFLRSLYRRAPEFQWETIAAVLELSDYYGCAGIISRADAWLCQECRKQEPAACCAAFELAARHRLGGAMAMLLPWAVQCMARGSRCSAVWYDGKQRCSRLKAAFEDQQLKCLVLDAFWWSREAQQSCPACACRPADVAVSWETRQEWASVPGRRGAPSSPACCCWPHPDMYVRAVQHYAHVLEEAKWACTPPHAGAALVAPLGGRAAA